MFHCNWLYLQPFSRYRALNLLGSRPWPFKVTWRHRSRDDSIPHIMFPIDAPLEPSPYLQAFSRYLALNCLSNENCHCAWAISSDLYPLCKIWVHIWISHPHIAYSLWHCYWAPIKIKLCLLVIPPMLNSKSSENFLSPDQNWANFGGFRRLGVRGFKKLRFLLQKARPCVNSRRLSHFTSKSVQVGSWKKPRMSESLP